MTGSPRSNHAQLFCVHWQATAPAVYLSGVRRCERALGYAPSLRPQRVLPDAEPAPRFSFGEVFAGIGGFRLGLEAPSLGVCPGGLTTLGGRSLCARGGLPVTTLGGRSLYFIFSVPKTQLTRVLCSPTYNMRTSGMLAV